jgi:hypothetical protein
MQRMGVLVDAQRSRASRTSTHSGGSLVTSAEAQHDCRHGAEFDRAAGDRTISFVIEL